MAKTKKAFQDSLTLVSLWGFLVIALVSFDVIDLSSSTTAFFLIVAGAGLFIEGEGLTIRKWASDGIQSNEVSRIFTIGVGIGSVVVGVLSLPFINVATDISTTLTGAIAGLTFLFFVLQRWVVD